ncbi:hypothetical protein ABT143_11665 [Streptomyces sp. NPDC002033]
MTSPIDHPPAFAAHHAVDPRHAVAQLAALRGHPRDAGRPAVGPL